MLGLDNRKIIGREIKKKDKKKLPNILMRFPQLTNKKKPQQSISPDQSNRTQRPPYFRL